MALDLGTLTGYLKLDPQGFTNPLKTAAAGMEGFKATALLAAAGVGAAVIGAGVALYKIGSQFDEVSDGIRAQTGATGKTLDGLVDSVKKVGTEVPASFEEIGPVVGTLNQRLGLTGPVLEKLSSQFVEYARISKDSLDPKAVSAAFKAFSVDGKDASKTLDQLFRISQDTGVPLSSLISSVQRGGPNFRAFGLDVQQSASLLGNLDKAGINGDRAVQALSRAQVQFAKDGTPMRKGLDDTINGIEGYIKSGNRGAAITLASKIFGTRGAAQFVDAVKSGALSVDALSNVTTKSSDTILKAGKDTADFGEQWQLFKNRALVAIEPVATRVFNAIGNGMAWINAVGVPALSGLGDNFRAFGAIVSGIWARFSGDSDGASSKLAQFQAIVASIWASVQVIFTAGVAIVTALWTTFGSTLVSYATNAFANIMTIVQGAFTIIQGIFQVFSALLQGDWSGVWEGLKTIVSGAWMIIQGMVSQAWNVITTVFSLAGEALKAILGAAWEALQNMTSTAFNAIVDFLSGIPGKIRDGMVTMVGFVGKIADDAWHGFSDKTHTLVGDIISFIKGIPGKAKDALANLASTLGDRAKEALDEFISREKTGITNIIQAFKDLPGKIKSGLGDLTGVLKSKGEDIVRGLISGIGALKDDVIQALLDLIPGPLKKFAGKLGISSPSKVFAGFGMNIGQGLVIGINGQQDPVARAAGALADAAINAHAKKMSAYSATAFDALAANPGRVNLAAAVATSAPTAESSAFDGVLEELRGLRRDNLELRKTIAQVERDRQAFERARA